MSYSVPADRKRKLFLWTALVIVVAIIASACRRSDPAESATPTIVASAGYPVSSATPFTAPYPVPEATERSTRVPRPTSPAVPPTVIPGTRPGPADSELSFLPFIRLVPSLTEPAATPQPESMPIIPLDFAAIRSDLNAQGQDLSYVKIGFHGSLLDEEGRLLDWMQQLDEAGVPFFLKSVGNAEPIYLAQEMARVSAVPHTLVFRSTGDVPDYTLPPVQAARLHWQQHIELFPPELDPSLVWLETINEVDRNLSQWLAQFALETARISLAAGFRWAAFGWAAGEPEPEDWTSPPMLEFLRLAADNPEKVAIALHEGSATIEDATFEYPYRTGRFLQLFEICDRLGIPRPTVLITEWGWAYNDIPPIDRALADINWAASLFAPFPQVKGAAMWMIGLGCCFGEISDEVLELVPRLTEFSLTHYFPVPLPPNEAPPDPGLYKP